MRQNELPKSFDGQAIQLTPARSALAFTRDTSISTSTQINLNSFTSIIEVQAVGGNVYLRYGTSAASNTNADEFIQLGQTRHYAVPSGTSAINVIDDGDSATVVVIEK